MKKLITIILIITLCVINCVVEVSAEEVKATAPSIQVLTIDSTQIRIQWKAVKNAEKYYVYMYDYDNHTYKQICSIKSTGCVHKGLKPDTNYTYKVEAEYSINGKKVRSAKSKAVTSRTATALYFYYSYITEYEGYYSHRSGHLYCYNYNTGENIHYGSFGGRDFVAYNGFIYYKSYFEEITYDKTGKNRRSGQYLCRSNMDGSDIKDLFPMSLDYQFCIYNGWVYYQDDSPNEDETYYTDDDGNEYIEYSYNSDKASGWIARAKLDGTDNSTLYKATYRDSPDDIYGVYKNYVYYKRSEPQNLMRLNTTTSEVVCVDNGFCKYAKINGNMLYYSIWDKGLFSLNLDTNEKTWLVKGLIRDFISTGNYVYYADGEYVDYDLQSSKLYKINTLNGKVTDLCKDSLFDRYGIMAYENNWIYFWGRNKDDKTEAFYKMHPDGSELTEINNMVQNIC